MGLVGVGGEIRFKMMALGVMMLLWAPLWHKFHGAGHLRFQDFWRGCYII